MDSSIRVRFSTEYEEYRVMNTAFAVPLKLGRKGLSEVIRHLLSSSSSSSAPEGSAEANLMIDFDFVINGFLLRTSLMKFIESQKLSNEEVLTILYMPALHLPEESKSTEVPSWVGSIDSSIEGFIATGCYNGQLQIFQASDLSLQLTIEASSHPLRAVKTYSSPTQDFIITGSKDHSIKCYAFSESKKDSKISASQAAQLKGHANSVECLDTVNISQTHMLLSGDWSGGIIGWDLRALESHNPNTDENEAGVRKKTKLNSTIAQPQIDIKPLFTLKGHSQCISSLQGEGVADGKLYSCSWDHSIKEWDVSRQDSVHSWVGSQVITSMHLSGSASLGNTAGSSLLLTSHTDGKIRLWDPRERETGLSRQTFGADSKQWVSQVRWHPRSPQHFASTDYEGKLHLWDLRSASSAVASKSVHNGKALCVDWVSDNRILTGGSDCCLTASDMGTYF